MIRLCKSHPDICCFTEIPRLRSNARSSRWQRNSALIKFHNISTKSWFHDGRLLWTIYRRVRRFAERTVKRARVETRKSERRGSGAHDARCWWKDRGGEKYRWRSRTRESVQRSSNRGVGCEREYGGEEKKPASRRRIVLR